MKNAAFVKSSTLALIAAFGVMQLPAGADPTAVPLSHFEAQVDDSLALSASQAGIESAQAELASAQAKFGHTLVANTIFGPQQDVEDQLLSRTYVRFEQDIGVKIPILGSREEEQMSVASANGDLQVARADYSIQRQQLLAQVRQAYVNYWIASQSVQMASNFVSEMQTYGPANEALRKNGFWTSADDLAYEDMVSNAQTDGEKALQVQRDALSELSLLTNTEVAPFTPVQPDFADCHPDAMLVSNQAINSDPTIQKYKSQIAEANQVLGLQRWVGYDADVRLGGGVYVNSVGAYLNSPGGTGYRLFGILDLEMPEHPGRLRADEVAKLDASVRQLNLLVAAREADIKTGVQVAVGDGNELTREIAQAGEHERSIAEDVREMRVRFTYVAPSSLADVQAKEQDSYTARSGLLLAQNALLVKVSDLLEVAPNACAAGTMAHTNAAAFAGGNK
jgi:outer membrane protein TolC